MQVQGQTTSTRPYLVRALHEWCVDNGFTPFVTVLVDKSVQVPQEFVKDGEIVLNIGFDATMGLRMGNDFMEFKARFGGVVREICVPIDHVMAIFARENGQGMAFPRPELDMAAPATEPKLEAPTGSHLAPVLDTTDGEKTIVPTATSRAGARPTLTRIK
jgi:stringent starvation protein B